MTISVKETTVFSVFHADAHDLFNTCSDLKKVAWELWDPERRLNDEVSVNCTHRVGELRLEQFSRRKPCISSAPSRPCSANAQSNGLKSR
jgi:hypothetical protein